MNIQEFIKETLTQIANGASDVNESLAEVGAYVPSKCIKGEGVIIRHEGDMPQNVVMVDFDIALTVSQSKSTSGGGGISIASIVKTGVQKEGNTENQEVNRIKFSVPLVLPDDKRMQENRRTYGIRSNN
jgi:hypothetical protein